MEWQGVSPTQIPALGRKVATWKACALDIETTGENIWLGAKVIGLGLSNFEDEKYYYLPLLGVALHDLRPIFDPLEQITLMGHNIKFDLHGLASLGWQGKQERFVDTLVMARLWARDQHPQLGLEHLAKQLFNYDYEYPDIVKRVKSGKTEDLDPRDLGYKCCQDLYLTKRLYRWLKGHMSPGLLKLFVRETELTRDLFDMEQRGALIDKEYLQQATNTLEKELSLLLGQICQQVGNPDFNPASPQQVRALMEGLGIKPKAYTPKGEASWKREALLQVRSQHPVALAIAKYKALEYQRNGMVQRAWDYIEAGCDEFHMEFKNWGTVTGRLSGDGQQMPKGWLQFRAEGEGEDILVWKHGEEAKEQEFSLRRLIKPRPGYVLVKGDYNQIEMHILGYYMKDPIFTAWLASGNVHAAAALEIWGDGEKYYDRGKVYNFATVYGQGDKSRAEQLGCSLQESQQYREDYNGRMPGYYRLLHKIEGLLQRDDFITNIYGREYWLETHLAYKGVNYICQGSAGDFCKFKLPETRDLRQQMGIVPILTTHDDIAFEVPLDSIGGLPELKKQLQQSPFGKPLEIDMEYSRDSLVQLRPLEELLNATT